MKTKKENWKSLSSEEQKDVIISNKLLYQFKNELIYIDGSKLLKLYDSEEQYNFFLGLISLTINKEPEFLAFLTKAIDNILTVINYNRKNFRVSENNIDLTNEIILNLNILNSESTETFKNEFREVQFDLRRYNFESDDDMLRSIAYDCHLINALETFSSKDLNNNLRTLQSTSYILEDFPEIYFSNPDYLDMNKKVLKEISKNVNKDEKKMIKVLNKKMRHI